MSTFWDGVAHVKDLASIATPVAVAILGIYINRTIQKQNKIAERRSALTKQWADEFSKLIDEIYVVSVDVLILYFKAAHHEKFVSPDEKDIFFENMNSEIRKIALLMEGKRIYLEKYVDLAPKSGTALSCAFADLHQEIRSWFSSKGGSADRFRELQSAFNQKARDAHREILRQEID